MIPERADNAVARQRKEVRGKGVRRRGRGDWCR